MGWGRFVFQWLGVRTSRQWKNYRVFNWSFWVTYSHKTQKLFSPNGEDFPLLWVRWYGPLEICALYKGIMLDSVSISMVLFSVCLSWSHYSDFIVLNAVGHKRCLFDRSFAQSYIVYTSQGFNMEPGSRGLLSSSFPASKFKLLRCIWYVYLVLPCYTYPSSHKHGSEKWVPPIVVTFQMSNTAIFHFHVYGGKGQWTIEYQIWISPRLFRNILSQSTESIAGFIAGFVSHFANNKHMYLYCGIALIYIHIIYIQ